MRAAPSGSAEVPFYGSAHAVGGSPGILNSKTEGHMLFVCTINWTEQGIHAIKDSPKRAKAARELAKKLGVEMKELYLTSGDSDLLAASVHALTVRVRTLPCAPNCHVRAAPTSNRSAKTVATNR